MNLVTWDPYRELGSLPSRFNHVFGALAPRERDEELSLGTWIPPVDIMEEKDRILLTAELPGFQESDAHFGSKMDRAPVLETRLPGVSAAFGSGQACPHHMSATA